MSNRNTLKHRVEVNTGMPPCFEVIAAFNVERIGVRYAQDCAERASKNVVFHAYKYRVMTLRGNKWVEVWKS